MDTNKGSGGGHGGGNRFLARLQEQISGGKYTDLVIRVRIREAGEVTSNTAPKRRRTGKGGAGVDDNYTDIRALTAILCVRSEYFEKALSGEWVEARERRVELVVHDAQELEDLKLLLKLSCMPDYTCDDGKRLPFATRVRMAVLADSFMFAEAVDQIIESLPLDADFDNAVAFVEGRLLPTLEHHPGVAEARKGMVDTLIQGIEASKTGSGNEEERAAAAAAGVKALAKCLGPVGGLFTARSEGYVMSPQVPFYTFKHLLASEALQLTSENEAYTLLTAWHRSIFFTRDEQFKELAVLLRYHHMSPDFLAYYVSQCPLMESSGLLHAVMRATYSQRNDDAGGGIQDLGLPNRGKAHDAVWNVEVSFTRQEIEALKERGTRTPLKFCSTVAGYPAFMFAKRVNTNDGRDDAAGDNDTLGVYFGIQFPKNLTPSVVVGAPAAGVKLNVLLSVPSIEYQYIFTAFFDDKISHGSNGFVNGSWEEMGREFIDDKLVVCVKAEYA